MSAVTSKTATEFALPLSIVSKADVSRLVREVEQIDNELTTAAVRARAGSPAAPQPVISGQLKDFLELNKLQLAVSTQARTDLLKRLRALKDKAPVIHMTFASTVDGASLQQLVAWLRSSVHAQAVLEIGLQPALVGGVHIRTPNQIHDFSLRSKLEGQHELLVKQLEALRGNN